MNTGKNTLYIFHSKDGSHVIGVLDGEVVLEEDDTLKYTQPNIAYKSKMRVELSDEQIEGLDIERWEEYF